MPKKRHTPEEIVATLRQVDVLTSQGKAIAGVIRLIGVSEATYHRWRNGFGGLKLDQAKRLKELELENSRLRKAVCDLTLEDEARLVPDIVELATRIIPFRIVYEGTDERYLTGGDFEASKVVGDKV